MGKEPEEKGPIREEGTHRRHLQFPQDSWTEIDAEGTDAEYARGRESQEPFYTPLVNEAAERRLKREREERARREGGEKGRPGKERGSGSKKAG